MLNVSLRSVVEREKSLQKFLNINAVCRRKGAWIFVYGLLAKNPPFGYETSKVVRVEGWQRKFHLLDPQNRGTSVKPGLTLGLAPGQDLEGIAYFIGASVLEEGLRAVWEQEMLLPFYIPTWIKVDDKLMITMVTDVESPAFLERSKAEVAQTIAMGIGKAGSNADYLQDVRDAFADHGVSDAYLEQIHQMLVAA